MTALTDQAIAKIKDLIMSGEFTAGSKLPNEQDLSQRLFWRGLRHLVS